MRYSPWSAVLGAAGEDDWKALGGAGGGGGAGSGEFCDSSLITGGELGASVVTGEEGGAAAAAASEGAPAAGRDPGGGCGPPGRPDSLLPILMTVSMSVHICKGRSVEAEEKAEAAVGRPPQMEDALSVKRCHRRFLPHATEPFLRFLPPAAVRATAAAYRGCPTKTSSSSAAAAAAVVFPYTHMLRACEYVWVVGWRQGGRTGP